MMVGCFAALWTPHIRLRADELEFAPLRTPVELPRDSVSEPWKPVLFKAWASRTDGTDLLLQGMVLRVSGSGGVKAFCLYCPHEQCILQLTTDTQAINLSERERTRSIRTVRSMLVLRTNSFCTSHVAGKIFSVATSDQDPE